MAGKSIPRASISRGGSGVDFEDGAFNLLQAGEHLAEVACLRVSLRAEHPHQALGRLRQLPPQRDKADCAVDVLAQDAFGRVEVSSHHIADRLAQSLS